MKRTNMHSNVVCMDGHKQRRSKRNIENDTAFLNEMISSNQYAMQEAPSKRRTTIHDLKNIRPMNDNQQIMLADFFQGNHIFAHGSAGTGKAQPMYSKILTPEGWKTMADMEVGTQVVTPNNSIANVVGVFPQGEKDIYTITFSDGAKTQACKDHLWQCNVPVDYTNSRASTPQVVSTAFIIEWLNKKNDRKELGKASPANLSINLVNPIEYTTLQTLPIHPYVLGILIGDGCLRTNTPTITSADSQIVELVNNRLIDGYVCRSIRSSNLGYSIVPSIAADPWDHVARKNEYTVFLQQLGLHSTYSNCKFIPANYLRSSIVDRMELLQGLMDADGTAGKKGDASFCTVSKQLAMDVQTLVWSIGGKARISVRQPSFTYKGIKKQGQPAYNVSISLPNTRVAFKLERKQNLINDTYQSKQLRRQIKSVELTGREPAQCIMLDNAEHLYITDDFIITHNTFLAMYAALCALLRSTGEFTKIIIIRTAEPVKDLGFLPGTVDEKLEVYERPYQDILAELTGKKTAYEYLKEQGMIEFISTSYIRGLSFDNAIIVVDEIQSMTMHEINSVMTRVGKQSQIILLGDIKQNDLQMQNKLSSGLPRLMKVLLSMDNFSLIEFTRDDIVRSKFVKDWIIAMEETK